MCFLLGLPDKEAFVTEIDGAIYLFNESIFNDYLLSMWRIREKKNESFYENKYNQLTIFYR